MSCYHGESIRRSLLLLSLLFAGSLQGNWPQWRGPNLTGAAPAAHDLPVTWSETENVVWRTKLPSWGASTPIIWENTIFISTSEEGFVDPKAAVTTSVPGKIFLLAINRKDGSIRWRKQIDGGNQQFTAKQNAASASPITDGKHVWTMTSNGRMTCLTMDGAEVWTRDIQADYGKFGLWGGYGSTPLMHGERLYVQVLHGYRTSDPSYILAVDRKTGKTVWRIERPTDAVRESHDSYGTPQIVTVDGVAQLVIAGGDYVTGHDLESGKELWRIGGFNPTNDPANRTIGSALTSGGYVFFSASRSRTFIGFRAGGSGNITGKAELWTNSFGADIPTPTTDGKYIYSISDRGVMNCFEVETGNVAYKGQRIAVGTFSASPLLADGKIYVTDEDGTTTILKAGPVFEVLGTAKLDGFTLASPVAVDNQIFIRTGEYLYCIQKR